MNNEKVSIIVPVYNAEKYLDECIKSLVNQTYKNIEIVLVDDGSLDSCPKICDGWAKKDERIKVIHKKNGGTQSAVIEGVKQSLGDFLCFVDGDDFVNPEFVETLYSGLKKTDADVCMCNFVLKFDDAEKIFITGQNDKLFEKGKDFKNLAEVFSVIFPSCRWNKIFRREQVVANLKNLDTKLVKGEDTNLTFLIFANSKKINYIAKPLVYYRQTDSSITHQQKDYLQNFEILTKKIFDCFIKNDEYVLKVFCDIFLKSTIRELLKYYFENKQSLKSFFKSFTVKTYLTYATKPKLTDKVVAFALKHKQTWLLKLWVKRG